MLDINNLPQVRTVEELREVMTLIGGGEPATDANLIWFVCCQEANTLSDMNRRELASLFAGGITAITTPNQVQEYIDTYFEDDEEYHEENNRCLLAGVAQFYGQHSLSDQLLAHEPN